MNCRDEGFDTKEAMIAEAKRRDCMLHCGYQDMWFTPEQLKAEHAKGSFRWGSCNFEFVSMRDYLAELAKEANHHEQAAINLRSQIAAREKTK